MIVCTMAATSFATAATFTVQETSKSSVFKVQYQLGQKGSVEVSILNNRNETVFAERINTTGSFVRPYNFSNLPYGDYTIVVKDDAGQYNEKVNYAAQKLVNYTYVTALPNQENKYWLNVRNNGQEQVNVRILTRDGILLFEQSVIVNGAYNSVFNLSKVKKNSAVTFEVTDGNNQTHTTTFE